MPGLVKLEVVRGPLAGRVFSFDRHDTLIFGRSPDCHACLPTEDEMVSRHPFLLEVNPPEARLQDLGSLNGTYVNNRKYGGRGSTGSQSQTEHRGREVDLHDGDTIRVGATVFSVHVEIPVVCWTCGKSTGKNLKLVGDWEEGPFICRACQSGREATT